MSWLPFRASHAAVAVGAVVAIAIGCNSSSSSSVDTSTFCGAAKAAASKCADTAADCDPVLTNQCTKLDAVLNRTLLEASRDCLESGVCGASSCLTRAQASMKSLTAHATLAKDYCATCAPGLANCASSFYARTGNQPGSLVLPYSESVAAAVDQACVTDANCASTFATCAAQTIADTVGQAIPSDLAACVSKSLQKDSTSVDTTPDGGPTVSKCTLENCQGCCRNDVCEEGDAGTGCGTGAVSCTTCSGDQSCKEGACREPCGPSNCPGCCDGDICREGTADGACGTDGATCDTCSSLGSSYACKNQQCVDTSCAVNCPTGCCDSSGCRLGTLATACGNNGNACVNCGSGNTCDTSSRTCKLNVDSTWDFVAYSATLPATNKSGASWDSFSGLPDPYVVVYSSGQQAQTTALTDTVSPVWNATTLTNLKASQYLANLSFNVWDSDYGFGVDPDDLMGGCTITVNQGLFNGKLYYWDCAATQTQGAVRLYFRFVKH